MARIYWKHHLGRLAILALLSAAMTGCCIPSFNKDDEDDESNAAVEGDEDDEASAGKKKKSAKKAGTIKSNDCEEYEEIEKRIDSSVTLDGCYDVTSNVTVSKKGHLTIKPGSVLRFAEDVGLYINEGKLTAEGTAENGILFEGEEDSAGFWRGIVFSNTKKSANKLSYVTIDGGGSDDNFNKVTPANLMLINSYKKEVRVTLENSTLRNSGAWGLSGTDSATFSKFANNTLTDNASGPAMLDVNTLGSLDADSDYSGNEKDRLAVSGKTLSTSATWKGINVPYHVIDGFSASGDDKALTIQPGAEFEFDERKAMSFNKNATLNAVGTKEKPIIFRGSDSAPKYWGGIRFFNSVGAANKLVYVTIDGGGSENTFKKDRPANLILTHGYKGETKVTLENSTLKNSGTWGISAAETTSFLSFKKNTLTGNALGPAILDVNVLGSLDAASKYTGNKTDLIEVTGNSLNASATWKAIDVPYHMTETFHLSGDGKALKIKPGAKFEFDENKGMSFNKNATLTAVGNAEHPIFFGGHQPAPKYWAGIQFHNTVGSGNQLAYVTFDGGGSDDGFKKAKPANLIVAHSYKGESKVSLKNVTFKGSQNDAISVAEGSTITACSDVNISASDIGGEDEKSVAAAVAECGL